MFHWTDLLGKLSVLIFEHPMSLCTCQSPTGNPSSHTKMSDHVTDTTFCFLPLCHRLLGNLGFMEQAHPSWSCLAAGCSALSRLYEEHAYALIPAVPKESRMCWPQLFSWLAVGGGEDQSSQPRGVFLQGAGNTVVLLMAARRKFGKPLGEHSRLWHRKRLQC